MSQAEPGMLLNVLHLTQIFLIKRSPAFFEALNGYIFDSYINVYRTYIGKTIGYKAAL